jgi:predicted AlkP superfamily pyrophosphatase or phosphodiesterase
LAILVLAGPALDTRVGAEPQSPAAVHRVLLVSVDGLRPDLALRARAPAMRSLLARGSFTFWATTTAVAVTLPSHVSMLTGVPPAKHGVEWNTDLPPGRRAYPLRPTLFELARAAGYTTAMVVGKAKLVALARPGSLDWSFIPAATISDSTVTDTAARWIDVHRPQVLFVHLAGVDIAGHAGGWGSPEQLEAVETADRCIARMLDALQRRDLLDSTVVLVTADHGGAALTHGRDDARSRHIPWIVAGPGIRENLDLTSLPPAAGSIVRTEDTFATLCYLLGLTPAPAPDGRAVTEILESRRTAGR